MDILILVIHVGAALGVIGLVLLQHGKGADAGAAFGSGASGSVFGATGSANFLSRTTAILATVFFITSIGLSVVINKQSGVRGVMTKAVEPAPAPASVPSVPAPAGQSSTVIPAPSAPAGDVPVKPAGESSKKQ
jgi:preprotein translocase subunit SecG